MGGRYLCSGSQLGTLIALVRMNKQEDANNLINKIIENQHIFNSKKSLKKDVKDLDELIKR